MFIIATAGFFTWILTREGLSIVIYNFLMPICNSSQTAALLIIAAVLFVTGCFLDTTAAILLVTPILMPIINNLGIDPIHFGVVMVVALMTGIITPPFGICLFVMADVAELPVSAVTRESVKYLPSMVITLLLVIFIPALSQWLPNLFFQ